MAQALARRTPGPATKSERQAVDWLEAFAKVFTPPDFCRSDTLAFDPEAYLLATRFADHYRMQGYFHTPMECIVTGGEAPHVFADDLAIDREADQLARQFLEAQNLIEDTLREELFRRLVLAHQRISEVSESADE